MTHIARRVHAMQSWMHFGMDIIARKTGVCRAEVFDTRDGSTVLFTNAIHARWICKRANSHFDYEAV